MKVPTKILLSTAFAGITTFASGVPAAHADNQEGYCWGVAAKGENGCAGKSADGKQKWGCHGNAPKAEWGWKKMERKACLSAKLSKDAMAAFNAAGVGGPLFTKSAKENPLFKLQK